MARDWVCFFIFLFFGAGGRFGFVFSFFPAPLSGLLFVGVRHPGFRFAPAWATILRGFAAERLYPHLKGSKSTVLPLARLSALKIPLVCAVDVRRCWAGLFLRPSRGWAAGGLVPWADAQGCSCFAADAARCGSRIELQFSLTRVIRLFSCAPFGASLRRGRYPGFRFAPPMGYDPTPLRGSGRRGGKPAEGSGYFE